MASPLEGESETTLRLRPWEKMRMMRTMRGKGTDRHATAMAADRYGDVCYSKIPLEHKLWL